ncbi:MAG: hypothetical protein JJE04_18125 [Acidobacteriia bacterium]|nr:hypothetical protein [Terriglobia bacterium]
MGILEGLRDDSLYEFRPTKFVEPGTGTRSRQRLMTESRNDPLLKYNPQEPVYFTGNFLLDCLRGFFSWAVRSVCSTGRKRQIFRLTSTNSPVRI